MSKMEVEGIGVGICAVTPLIVRLRHNLGFDSVSCFSTEKKYNFFKSYITMDTHTKMTKRKMNLKVLYNPLMHNSYF